MNTHKTENSLSVRFSLFSLSSLSKLALVIPIVTFRSMYIPIDSVLPLSRLRLSRITANLEVKISSLFYHGNLTRGKKILWKRGEIAPRAISSLFRNIFKCISILQESNYIFICEMWLFDLSFPQFCKAYMSRNGYLELFQRVLWSSS